MRRDELEQIIQRRNYLKSSLWVIPFVAIPLALVAMRLLHWLDAWLGWSLLDFTATGAKVLLEAFVTATLSFVVFTFGSLLVAIQVASAQMTPRIIATTLLRNDVVKYTVGLLIFTLMFALSAQNRMEKDVHQLVMLVATLLGILSFAAFFYLIDYASRLLRPISILAHVGSDGLAVDRKRLSRSHPRSRHPRQAKASISVLRTASFGIRERRPSFWRSISNCSRLRPRDRTASSNSFPRWASLSRSTSRCSTCMAAPDRSMRTRCARSVAFGSERTMEQDPTFAFRIVVDIALKALSPAINDPTTAVLAIDQLHRMLRTVGKRHLRTDEILDKSGQLRVIFRTPNWEDFVHLAFSEIRACGSNNLQIVRRLRAMIENLVQTLPAHRHAALLQQLSLLDREIERNFVYPEDLALARIADPQGLGGHPGQTMK